jgi:hypothetical protein
MEDENLQRVARGMKRGRGLVVVGERRDGWEGW